MNQEYPDAKQRVAVCTSQSRAGSTGNMMQRADEEIAYSEISREASQQITLRIAVGYKYKDPVTGEVYEFARKGVYKKNGRVLILVSGSKEEGKK